MPPRRVRRNPDGSEGKGQRVVALLEPSRLHTPVIGDPLDMLNVLSDYIGSRAHEVFAILHLNGDGEVISHSEFSEGHMGRVTITASGVFREALVAGAQAIITAHQHPNSSCNPSPADRRTWELLVMLGEALQIPVVDNLVIGNNGVYSESMERQTGGNGIMTWAMLGRRRR